MDERRGLKGVIRPLTPQVIARKPAQFLIDQRDQTLRGAFVAIAPGLEDLGDVGGMGAV